MAELIPDFPLANCNTFRFDVRADYGCVAASVDALRTALTDARTRHAPTLFLGGGSNVVLTGDFRGLAIRVALAGRRVSGEDADAYYVQAAAGENWHEFVMWTLAQGLPGLENLALIPGTVGAAPVQNIGAYGVELADRFERLSALDLHTHEIVEFDRTDCAFGYRDSFFKGAGRDRYVITSVTFRLAKTWTPVGGYADVAGVLSARQIDTPGPMDIFDAVVAVRRAKLPDPALIGNAGSFFKNPVVEAGRFDALRQREPGIAHHRQHNGSVKLAAGWMIDQCGWKGRRLGAAAVHDRQALVLVNTGGARGADVLALADAIATDVKARYGVQLEREPVVI